MSINIRKLALTIPVIFLSGIFIYAGGTKLLGLPSHVEDFARWGYPLWFMYVIGTVELSGALLLLVPFARFYGGVLLAGNMAGAVFTHIMAAEFTVIPVPLTLLIALATVAWLNRPVWVTSLLCGLPVIRMAHACQP